MKVNMNFNSSTNRGNTLQNLRLRTNNQPITIYQSQQAHLDEEFHSKDPFNGLKYTYVQDPVAEIEHCKGILIKQYPDSFDFISGFETCNKYYIFGINNDNSYKYLFKCEEKINCFMQFLCPVSNKKLDMNLMHVSSIGEQPQKIGNISKPYTCSCFCICRPELILTLEDSRETVGKIKEDFCCIENAYKVIDIKNKSRYLVKANCCQCGLFFSNSLCGKNCDASFSIVEPITQEQLGIIAKQNTGDKKNVVETYEIKFPRNATSNDKLLLTALGVMIDYQFFELDPRKVNENVNKDSSLKE